jgi:hypothetical protein
MNYYQKINNLFIKNSDLKIENLNSKNLSEIDFSSQKNHKYLFNNRLVYPFLINLENVGPLSNQNKELLEKGKQKNKQYLKSLYKVYQLCKKNKIEFLLYKTHRFIPGVVDGDIDLIVKKEDFDKFLEVFRAEGFDCIEDEPRKGKCEKEGFLVIEPHIGISWRGQQYIDEKILWGKTFEINYQLENIDFKVKNVSFEIETIAIFYNIFFEPNYLDLRSYLNLKYFQTKIDFNNLPIEKEIQKYIQNLLQEGFLEKKFFPLFAPFYLFLSQWTKVFFIKKKVSFKIYLLHIIFYCYWRLRYKLIQVLPYTHSW